ncbi:MAG: M50 family metallopeptidase [Candidatus Diapherotrites archaeon]
MKNSFSFGRILGISLELHITFILLIIAIAAGILLLDTKNFIPTMLLLFFLFLSVFLHELVHSIVAVYKGVKVKKIILLPIGGLAQTERMPEKPLDEFLISIAGPLFNFLVVFAVALSVVFLHLPFPSIQQLSNPALLEQLMMQYPLFALFWVNLILGAFNLFVPAMPMDGGRVLRSLLAIKFGTVKATGFATKLSIAIAAAMFLIGIFANFWLAIIAVFVYFGAQAENEATQIKAVLERSPIKKLIKPLPKTVSGEKTLKELYGEMKKRNQTGLLIKLGKGLGYIGIESLKQEKKENWGKIKAKEKAQKIPSIPIESTASEALTKLMQSPYSFFTVKEKAKITGIIEQSALTKLFQLKRIGEV